MTLFCSTIIATIGRPSLARAVESVLAQTCPAGFEVIVVNDSAQPLSAAAWQADPRVRILATNRRERCVARNAGAAVAAGAFLHFLDDDDWLLPGALQALHAASQRAQADWYVAGSQLVNRVGQPTIQHQPAFSGNAFIETMAGEWLPLPTSLIAASAFFAVGGFDPEALYVEDNDLARSITLRGAVHSTPALVACVALGEANSTTIRRLQQTNGWAAREKVLADAGCFARMRAGTSSAYMRGRIARCYLTSAMWNARRRRVTTVLSRAAYAAAALALGAPHWANADFWRAISGPYHNPTFARGQSQAHALPAESPGPAAPGSATLS